MTTSLVQPYGLPDLNAIARATPAPAVRGATPTPPGPRHFHTASEGGGGPDTFMDGFFIGKESYAIYGTVLVDTGVKVYGDDDLFITVEPRNLEPLELLVHHHRLSARPILRIYDWWLDHHTPKHEGWAYYREIDDAFQKEFGRQVLLPGNRKGWGFNFFNGYLPQVGRNSAALQKANGEWTQIYAAPPGAGKPQGPSGDASGWAVAEFKRADGKVRFPDIPSGTGHAISAVLDNVGQLIPATAVGLTFRQEANQYRPLLHNAFEYAVCNP